MQYWVVPSSGGDAGLSYGNYWIAPQEMQGEFVLKFDQPRIVETITIVNMHNPGYNDRGTNEFKVTNNIYFIHSVSTFHDIKLSKYKEESTLCFT